MGPPAFVVGPTTPRYHPNDEDLSLGSPEKRGANKHCAYGAGNGFATPSAVEINSFGTSRITGSIDA